MSELDELKSLRDRLQKSLDRLMSSPPQIAPTAAEIEQRKRILRDIEDAIRKYEQGLDRSE